MQAIVQAIEANPSEVVALVRRALEDTSIWGFGELLDHPVVQAAFAVNAELEAVLRLFCFHSWRTYIDHPDSYPTLSEGEVNKLRTLTLVQLASRRKELSYAEVQAELLLEPRELEELVLEAIYGGAIEAKLSQASQIIEVDWCVGRDVSAGELSRMAARLEEWNARAKKQVTLIDRQLDLARSKKASNDADFALKRDLLKQKLDEAMLKLDQRDGEEGSHSMGDKRGFGGRRNKRGRGGTSGGKRKADDEQAYF